MQEDVRPEDELLRRYRDGLCTPEEERLVDQWFNLYAEHAPDAGDIMDAAAIRDEIWQRLPASRQPRKRRLWPVWAAAACVAALTGALLFTNTFRTTPPIREIAYSNDVSPGKTGATLTLANGQKIRLSDQAEGELAKQAGVTIRKSASGVLVYEIAATGQDASAVNTLSTSPGESYEVQLPDGSVISLNSASSLEYPANIAGRGERRVKLTGEAFFKVAKDAQHPFIVEAGNQTVQVLGTEFNINCYADEPAVATTLIGGSVSVKSNGATQLLVPGQQALSRNGGLEVAAVETDSIVDWKNGDFYLNHVDFRTAMRKIARWYDVEVVYDASVPANLRSGGWISRSNNLSTVLKSIEHAGLVTFRIEGRKIYVTR